MKAKIEQALLRSAEVDARNITVLLDAYSNKGDSRQAETIAGERLKADPDDLPALVTLGVLAQRNGKHSDAAQNFEKVVALTKHFAVAQRQQEGGEGFETGVRFDLCHVLRPELGSQAVGVFIQEETP